MRIWKIGIIGAGVAGNLHARAIKELSNTKLVAVCDASSQRADQFAAAFDCRRYDNHEDLLRSHDLDIITVATPTGLHLEPVLDAAKAGVHVLCEKPLEINPERIDAMIETHNKSGTKLGCFFPARYMESLVPVKRPWTRGGWEPYPMPEFMCLGGAPMNIMRIPGRAHTGSTVAEHLSINQSTCSICFAI